MAEQVSRFDCRAPFRAFVPDVTRSNTQRLVAIIRCYEQAYDRLTDEVRRLENENANLKVQLEASTEDLRVLQQLADAFIANLDPEQD